LQVYLRQLLAMSKVDHTPIQALILEDVEADAVLLKRELCKTSKAECSTVATLQEFDQKLKHEDFDVVLSDFNLTSFDAFDALRVLKETGKDIPFILVSGAIGETTAIELMKAGASDFIRKGEYTRLQPAIDRELREALNRRARREAVTELERKNRDLDQFAAVAAHDLRSPLHSMGQFAELLKEEYGDRLDKTGNEYLDFIMNGATRGAKLVERLLQFSRLGRERVDFVPFPLKHAFDEAKENINGEIQRSQAVVKWNPEQTPIISGDSSLITQLFQNLMSNAIKFCKQRKPEINVGIRRIDGFYLVDVSDNGIGIPPEQESRVFDVFYRAHTQASYEGTGLGLAIVKRIVELHGGTISVRSKLGLGTTFTFTLPAP
jgi:signal transduction histidine kinase